MQINVKLIAHSNRGEGKTLILSEIAEYFTNKGYTVTPLEIEKTAHTNFVEIAETITIKKIF